MRWTLQPGTTVVAFNQGWVQEIDANRSLRFRTEDSGVHEVPVLVRF